MNTTHTITEINRAIRILEEAKAELEHEAVPIPMPLTDKRIAVCVGHSRPGDFGATACDGMTTEFAWNHKLAVELSEFLEAMGAKVLLLDYYGESTQT